MLHGGFWRQRLRDRGWCGGEVKRRMLLEHELVGAVLKDQSSGIRPKSRVAD